MIELGDNGNTKFTISDLLDIFSLSSMLKVLGQNCNRNTVKQAA